MEPFSLKALQEGARKKIENLPKTYTFGTYHL